MARNSKKSSVSLKYASARPNALPVRVRSLRSRTGKSTVYGSISAFATNVLGNPNKRRSISRRLAQGGGTVDGYVVEYATL